MTEKISISRSSAHELCRNTHTNTNLRQDARLMLQVRTAPANSCSALADQRGYEIVWRNLVIAVWNNDGDLDRIWSLELGTTANYLQKFNPVC